MPSLFIPTEREAVVLKELTIDDAQAYFDAVEHSRKHLSQFGDDTSRKYPTLESVEESIRNPKDPDKLRMGIWDEDMFVGSINATPDDNDSVEVGYWVDIRRTGKGYAPLAVQALSPFLARKYRRVHADVAADNHNSIRVLEKTGYMLAMERAGKLIFAYNPGLIMPKIQRP